MNCSRCGVELMELNKLSDRRYCKACLSKQRKKAYLENKEKYLTKNKIYYDSHRIEQLKYHQDRQKVYVERNRERDKNLKLEIIKYYSSGTMACANPYGEHKEPYTTLEALSIDHINGGGTKERLKRGGKGGKFYFWLKKQGFPSSYQILCMNCQFIKRIRNKELGSKRFDIC